MKRRTDDSIQNNNIYIIFIITLIFFFISLLFFERIPKFFINFSNKIFNINQNDKYNIIFDTELKKINTLHQDRILNSKNEIEQKIFAKSYIVYDVKNNKIIFSKNENTILPLASLTKIISATLAINIKDRNTIIKIDSKKMREDEKIDYGLKEGQNWKLGDLLKYGLTISSNASMDIIAGTLFENNSDFVSKMNDYMKSLGFKDFYFNSASGLDYGNIIGGKGNALEYARFFSKAYELIPDIMSYTVNSKVNLESKDENIYAIPNTNQEAGKSVGLLASKTGFTDAAGGNLAVMINFDVNRPIVIVVLGSTPEERFKDVDKLYKATKDILELK